MHCSSRSKTLKILKRNICFRYPTLNSRDTLLSPRERLNDTSEISFKMYVAEFPSQLKHFRMICRDNYSVQQLPQQLSRSAESDYGSKGARACHRLLSTMYLHFNQRDAFPVCVPVFVECVCYGSKEVCVQT